MATKPPRQPKLRSSCDGCGAAKLKCDRRQPTCGRCADLGLTCIYGVSRKMGKPPRDRLQLSASRGKSPGDRRPSSAEKRKFDDADFQCHRPRRSGSETMSTLSATSSTSSNNEMESAWGSVSGDEFGSMGTSNTTMLDAFPPLTNFASMDLGDWALTDELSSNNMDKLDPDLLATFEWPDFDSTATPPPYGQQSHSDPLGSMPMPFKADKLSPPTDGCNCLRETHEILHNLSLINPDKTPTPLAPGPMITGAGQFPLDYVLNLNRECSEHLSRLLNCSCIGCPHLGLLHASIISQILMWYHQEGASSIATPNHLSPFMNTKSIVTTSQPGPRPTGLTSSTSSASLWSGSTAIGSSTTTGGRNTPTHGQSSGQMAMGCFIIDDERVQCALRIQLLLAELTKIGSLISAFSARSKISDVSASGAVDPLYKSLGSWLSKEHSSIVDLLRTKLSEISI
ncbi:hypothetical protein G7054_g672 [Neopestalotiopsis clavispora]|nr:hypothetical protein G7054_g672 [Neopestalotiopsis clavispora]